jgi:hypothetical protein
MQLRSCGFLRQTEIRDGFPTKWKQGAGCNFSDQVRIVVDVVVIRRMRVNDWLHDLCSTFLQLNIVG